ncbi:hypothetical protein H8356DRAFT_1716712 [Neocallimastix lanati (nom. inval.)]|jgi:hypothetical protein
MKFTTQFFTLVAASIALVYSYPNEKGEDLSEKKPENTDGSKFSDFFADLFSKDSNEDNNEDTSKNDNFSNGLIDSSCENALDEYEDCLSDDSFFDKENTEMVCNIYNSQKCQKLFQEGVNIIPECKDIGKTMKFLVERIIKLANFDLSYKCTKDEKGQYCPLDVFNADERHHKKEGKTSNTSKEDDKLYSEALTETCKSQKCTNALLNTLSELEAIENELKSLFSSIGDIPSKFKREDDEKRTHDAEEFLLANNCTELAAKLKSVTSDASSSYKFGSALFISLGLLLFTLF